MTPAGDGLPMREVVERTGVGEATLRAWETRYGFPAPRRLPSGTPMTSAISRAVSSLP